MSSAEDVGSIETIRVTVRQEGRDAVNEMFMPPVKVLEKDAGTVIAPQFFHRITLPDSWDEGPAEIRVEALSPSAPTLRSEGMAEIRPGNVVAAYVDLERNPKGDDDDDAGAGDADADGGGGDAGSDAGPRDAGMNDASAADAGATDASSGDAAAGDGGSLNPGDASLDASASDASQPSQGPRPMRGR